jgi:hypothetical protein
MKKLKILYISLFFILGSILDASDIFIVKVNKVFDNNASYCIKFWCLNSNLCPCSIDNFKNIFPFLDKQNSLNYSQDNILCYGEKFESIFKNEKIVSIKKNNQKVDMSFLLTQDKLDIKFHKTLNLSNNTEKTTQINTSVSIKNEWQIIGFNSVNEKLYCPQKNCFFCRFD